jgi:hypothetical protein
MQAAREATPAIGRPTTSLPWALLQARGGPPVEGLPRLEGGGPTSSTPRSHPAPRRTEAMPQPARQVRLGAVFTDRRIASADPELLFLTLLKRDCLLSAAIAQNAAFSRAIVQIRPASHADPHAAMLPVVCYANATEGRKESLERKLFRPPCVKKERCLRRQRTLRRFAVALRVCSIERRLLMPPTTRPVGP